ncbi:hypothetical protein ACF1E9_08195 [Streptomyces roseolus]
MTWAAGLWVLTYNAKKESAQVENGSGCTHLANEAAERLRRAGA